MLPKLVERRADATATRLQSKQAASKQAKKDEKKEKKAKKDEGTEPQNEPNDSPHSQKLLPNHMIIVVEWCNEIAPNRNEPRWDHLASRGCKDRKRMPPQPLKVPKKVLRRN